MSCFYRGDCLTHMRTVKDKSIDFIYWNPPFGTTHNSWDEKLDWQELFAECFRILKDDGVLAIHCSIPFNYTLIRAAPKPPSYSWYWKKERITCALNAKRQPMRCVEEILIWTNKKPRYIPQRVGIEQGYEGGRYTTSYVGQTVKQTVRTVVGKYQTHFLDMPRHIRGFATRSDEMVRLFLRHYTREGDTVLDPTCYKGLTGRICTEMNRRWIGIDKYFLPTEWISQTDSNSDSLPSTASASLPSVGS